LTNKLLSEFKTQIKELTLVPAGGGVFELEFNGDLVYSKKKSGKFPDESWVLDTARKRLS
jgi:selenoprotein W-related protein